MHATYAPTLQLDTEHATAELDRLVARGLINDTCAEQARRDITRCDGCVAGYLEMLVERSQRLYVRNFVPGQLCGGKYYSRQQAEAMVGWTVTIVTREGWVYAGVQVTGHHIAPFGDSRGVLDLAVDTAHGTDIVDVVNLATVYAIAPTQYAPGPALVVLGPGTTASK